MHISWKSYRAILVETHLTWVVRHGYMLQSQKFFSQTWNDST